MRVEIEKTDGIISSVQLVDSDGASVVPVDRFLAHVLAAGGSPNTASAYGYDLRYVFEFFAERDLDWRQFRPALALDLLGWLRRRPSSSPGPAVESGAGGPARAAAVVGDGGPCAGHGVEFLPVGDRR